MTIQISGLDPASSASDTDLLLLRQGLVDKQVQVGLIRTIALASFPSLSSPSTALQNDVMLISRAGVNHQIRFAAVGLQAGVIMWFYSDSAPNGWAIENSTSGALLSVKGPGGVSPGPGSYSSPGNVQGDWLQLNHTLTLNEIPSHRHGVSGTSASTGSGNVVQGYRNGGSDFRDWFTQNAGGGQGHNHGNLWRPAAHVGILCKKVE